MVTATPAAEEDDIPSLYLCVADTRPWLRELAFRRPIESSAHETAGEKMLPRHSTAVAAATTVCCCAETTPSSGPSRRMPIPLHSLVRYARHYPLAHVWPRKETSSLLQCAFLLQVFPPPLCTCRKPGYQFVAFEGPFKLSTCIPASLCRFSFTKWLFGNNKTPKGQFSSQNARTYTISSWHVLTHQICSFP